MSWIYNLLDDLFNYINAKDVTLLILTNLLIRLSQRDNSIVWNLIAMYFLFIHTHTHIHAHTPTINCYRCIFMCTFDPILKRNSSLLFITRYSCDFFNEIIIIITQLQTVIMIIIDNNSHGNNEKESGMSGSIKIPEIVLWREKR